uniref:Uncharacterized protein n=1 Tax=Callorhinchus milii TaxID=7868 RepID=A0A4W3I0H7_CALMI
MEALSKTVKTCCEALGVQSNVFSHLLEKVAKSAPGVLDQLLCHNYESRIYCFLSQTLRHIDPLGFDSLIADYIAFVRSEHTYDLRFYLVFTEICINTILYWVFARRAHPVFVQKLLENTILYLSDKDSLLALIWRWLCHLKFPMKTV